MQPPIDPHLRPVPTPPPRHAEGTDSRLSLRHYDENAGKRRRGDDDQAKAPNTEDAMTLSVGALIDFLEQYHAGLTNPAPPTTAPPPTTETAVTPTTTGALNPQTREAARAYGHAAALRQTAAPSTDATSPIAVTDNVDDLLNQLRALHRRGVPGIQVNTGDNFMGNLARAIATSLGG